jgi:glycine/sarcosine N-methyltransferase
MAREDKMKEPGESKAGGAMEARDFYDELGEDYDLMVSWEERISREEDFLKERFNRHGARRVLDAACGTGMHAVRFAQWGLSVSAADLSRTMVEKAAENARRAGTAVDAHVAAFGGLTAAFGTGFDAVTCLGNSLPHLLDDASLTAALSDMAAALRPGGILVLQNRNYDRVLREKQRFMPAAARPAPEGEVVFLRMTDFRGGDALDFTIFTLRRRGGEWGFSARTTPLRAMGRATLETALKQAGFGAVDSWGSYRGEAYDAPGTADLIIVAVR